MTRERRLALSITLDSFMLVLWCIVIAHIEEPNTLMWSIAAIMTTLAISGIIFAIIEWKKIWKRN